MTICDRIRTEHLRAITNTGPSTIPSKTNGSSHSSDSHRMCTALTELRSYCRTEAALKSFEIFESNLRKTSDAAPRSMSSQYSGSGSDVGDEEPGEVLHVRLQARDLLQHRAPAATAKRISRIPTPVRVEPPLPSIFSKLALVKSKTTGNLSSLSSLGLLNRSTSKVSLHSTSQKAEHKVNTSGNGRREFSNERFTQKNREITTGVELTDSLRRSSGRTASIVSGGSSPCMDNIESSGPQRFLRPPIRHSTTTVSFTHARRESSFVNLSQFGAVEPGVSSGMIEAGHQRIPPPRTRSPYSDVKLVGGQKIVRSKSKVRMKPERLSSGEIVKGFLDSGLNQVKRMGKRVGGSMSWAGSADDLSSVVNGSVGSSGR
jgi:hypothetical protein